MSPSPIEDMIDFKPLFDAVGGEVNLIKSLKETYFDADDLTVSNIGKYLLDYFYETVNYSDLTEDNTEEFVIG